MKLILTRHGETTENTQKIVYGHLPGELTVNGINQAEKTADLLVKEHIDVIFSSDLKRCVDTTNIILKNLANCPVYTSSQLREQQQNSLYFFRTWDLRYFNIIHGQSISNFVQKKTLELNQGFVLERLTFFFETVVSLC